MLIVFLTSLDHEAAAVQEAVPIDQAVPNLVGIRRASRQLNLNHVLVPSKYHVFRDHYLNFYKFYLIIDQKRDLSPDLVQDQMLQQQNDQNQDRNLKPKKEKIQSKIKM